VEFEAPEGNQPGRLAWHGWAEGDADHRLDVIHAWLIENLPEGRVRILTQESQKGKPAKDLFQHQTGYYESGPSGLDQRPCRDGSRFQKEIKRRAS